MASSLPFLFANISFFYQQKFSSFLFTNVLLTVCFCKSCATICCKCLSEWLLVLLHGWNRNWGQIFALSFSLSHWLVNTFSMILTSKHWSPFLGAKDTFHCICFLYKKKHFWLFFIKVLPSSHRCLSSCRCPEIYHCWNWYESDLQTLEDQAHWVLKKFHDLDPR